MAESNEPRKAESNEPHKQDMKFSKNYTKYVQLLLKQIGLGKQKLIFYLAYIRSGNFRYAEFSDELRIMISKIKNKEAIETFQ